MTGQTVEKGEALALLYSPDLVVTVRNLQDARRSGNRDLERMARDRLQLWGIEPDEVESVVRTQGGTMDLIIRSPIQGHIIKKYPLEGEYVEEGARLYDVADLSTVWIEAQVYEEDVAFLQAGLSVRATTKSFPNRLFSGKVSFIHPHLDTGTRTLKVRFDMENPHHELRPGMYATVTLQVPITALHVLPPDASEEQQRAYEQGLILAVPERAVIDTGNRKIVYREAEPNVYEGVEVQLGPRCGVFYPAIKGLKAGDNLATAGSFLLDAETRLTAGVGSTYFGAGGGLPTKDRRSATTARPSLARDDQETLQAALAKLGPEDQRLARAQGYCPIHEFNRLGLMGTPAKVTIKGQPVFLCCPGCEEEAREHSDATLARVEQLKTKVKGLSSGR